VNAGPPVVALVASACSRNVNPDGTVFGTLSTNVPCPWRHAVLDTGPPADVTPNASRVIGWPRISALPMPGTVVHGVASGAWLTPST